MLCGPALVLSQAQNSTASHRLSISARCSYAPAAAAVTAGGPRAAWGQQGPGPRRGAALATARRQHWRWRLPGEVKGRGCATVCLQLRRFTQLSVSGRWFRLSSDRARPAQLCSVHATLPGRRACACWWAPTWTSPSSERTLCELSWVGQAERGLPSDVSPSQTLGWAWQLAGQ